MDRRFHALVAGGAQSVPPALPATLEGGILDALPHLYLWPSSRQRMACSSTDNCFQPMVTHGLPFKLIVR